MCTNLGVFDRSVDKKSWLLRRYLYLCVEVLNQSKTRRQKFQEEKSLLSSQRIYRLHRSPPRTRFDFLVTKAKYRAESHLNKIRSCRNRPLFCSAPRPSLSALWKCVDIIIIIIIIIIICWSPWSNTSLGAHLHVVGMLRIMSDINQLSLPTPYYLLLCLLLSLWPIQRIFIP